MFATFSDEYLNHSTKAVTNNKPIRSLIFYFTHETKLVSLPKWDKVNLFVHKWTKNYTASHHESDKITPMCKINDNPSFH